MCRLHVRSLTRSKNPSTSYYLLRNHNPTLCIPPINFLQLPLWMDDNPVFCLWTTLYYLFQIFLDFFQSTLEFLEYLSFLHWIYSTVCCSSWSLPFISMMSLMLSERSRRQADHSLCGAMPKLIVEYKPLRLCSINVVLPMMGFFCALLLSQENEGSFYLECSCLIISRQLNYSPNLESIFTLIFFFVTRWPWKTMCNPLQRDARQERRN